MKCKAVLLQMKRLLLLSHNLPPDRPNQNPKNCITGSATAIVERLD